MRRCFWLAVLSAAALALVLPSSADGEILRLKDGSFLQGKVVDSDKKFVTFLRWDTGGVVRLSWQQLTEEDRLRMGRKLGLIVTEDARAIKVDGMRFTLKTGEVIEGVLVEETDAHLLIRTTPGKPFKYPRSVVKSREPLKLDILRVYTEEEAYQRKLETDGEPADFQGHMARADYCQRLGYFEMEKEHLEKANGLGAPDESQQQLIDNRLEILVELIKDREVLRRIKAINRLIANKKFAEAQDAWKDVQGEYPQSKIVTDDLEKVEDKIAKEKANFLRSVVVRGWFSNLRSLVQSKVREKELTLADAKKWAQRELSREILTRLTEAHSIEEGEIKETFDNRKTYVYYKATYGTGTFIVEKSKSSKSGSGSSIIDQLGEKIGLGKDAREKVKEAFGFSTKKKKKDNKTQTPDDWWEKATSSMKYQWLTAFYAENSGDIEVVRLDTSACSECGGKGYKSYIASGSEKAGTKYEVCRKCHGLGKFKIVVFK
jgi:hypothetical protein